MRRLIIMGKCLAALAVLVGLTAAVHGGEGTNTNTVTKVTIEELLKNKETWKGKRVEVSGYYMTHFEVSALYENALAATSAETDRSLWIDYHDVAATDKGKLKWVESGFIRVIGTFDYRTNLGSGHLNQWPARVTKVELVEPIADPAKRKANEAKA